VGQRAAIVAAGPIANFILAILLFAGLFATFGRSVTPAIVGEVLPGSAAEAAGFKAGDRILSVDGRQIQWFSDLQLVVKLRAETALNFVVDRDGREISMVIAPRRVAVDDGFGVKREQGQIGIKSTNERETISYGPLAALGQGVKETFNIVDTTFTYLGRIIQGRESGKELGGPLGIAKMSGDVASISWLALINLAAAISVSIGLINLFPVPLLDGGHLLYYAFEAARGRPLGERAQEYGFRLGMVLVLGLFIFATWNDLVQLRVVSFLSGLFS
jgi:regulator of sigma E protease